jgi:hypothetical protein
MYGYPLILLPDVCERPVKPQAPAQEEGANARFRATAAAAAAAAAPSGRARCRPCRAVIAKEKTRLEVCASVRPGRHAATRLGHTPRARALCDRPPRRAWWVGGAGGGLRGGGRKDRGLGGGRMKSLEGDGTHRTVQEFRNSEFYRLFRRILYVRNSHRERETQAACKKSEFLKPCGTCPLSNTLP